MKGCFILQRRFVYIGHNIAVFLKENYGVKDFCSYVLLRPSYNFLKSQTDINYTKLLLDEEIHKDFKKVKLDIDYLRWLEKEYGIPNLWPYLTVDRVIMSNQAVREYPYDTSPYTHEEMLKILQVKAKAILDFLEREKPDFIFASVIGSVGVYLLYHIAKKKNIKMLVVLPTSIKNTYTISEHYAYFTEVEKKMFGAEKEPSATSMEKAKQFIQNFRSHPAPYYDEASPQRQPVFRYQQMKFLLPHNLLKICLWTAKYLLRYFQSDERQDYSYSGPFNYIKDGIKRKLRNLIGAYDLYDTFNPTDDFVFFPLHLEPEISLLLQAQFFTDQLHTIKMIARSLPVGYQIYVKEHPLMVPYRPRSFYKQLKKTPNVKLLDPSITSFQIIPHAKLITVITGAAGWEATILGKPVITFGEIFYNKLSFVGKCPKIEDLPFVVKNLLENPRFDEDELIRYIAAVIEESADVNLQYLWEHENDMEKKKEGVKTLADLLAKKLNLQKNA